MKRTKRFVKKEAKYVKHASKNVSKAAITVEREVKKHIITALSAALAFVIALFWRDAVQAGIDEVLANLAISTGTYVYKLIAAVIVTIIGVVGIVLVARMNK